MFTTQILHQNIFTMFFENKLGKNMVDVQKSLKGASAEADFWHGKNIDHAEKKSSK